MLSKMCFYDKEFNRNYYLQNKTIRSYIRVANLNFWTILFDIFENFRLDFKEKLKRSDGSQSRSLLYRRKPIGMLVVGVCGN